MNLRAIEDTSKVSSVIKELPAKQQSAGVKCYYSHESLQQ